MLQWYCIPFPFGFPPSVAWGTIRTLPGSSRTEVYFPVDVSQSFMFSNVVTKRKQTCYKAMYTLNSVFVGIQDKQHTHFGDYIFSGAFEKANVDHHPSIDLIRNARAE